MSPEVLLVLVVWLACFCWYLIGALLDNARYDRSELAFTFGPRPVGGAIVIFLFAPLLLVASLFEGLAEWWRDSGGRS